MYIKKKLCFKYFSGHMDVSVIVSWFIDVSTHNALGSICNDTTTRHLSFYMWVSCAKSVCYCWWITPNGAAWNLHLSITGLFNAIPVIHFDKVLICVLLHCCAMRGDFLPSPKPPISVLLLLHLRKKNPLSLNLACIHRYSHSMHLI